MNTNEKMTCADLVKEKFNETEQDYIKASQFFNEYDNATEGEQIALKVISDHVGNDYHNYDDLYDYINQTALSWDYVEPYTFNDQREGYYRLQLSWGGPSDEFRIYTDIDKNISNIEYWYLDWYDGACTNVPENSLSYEICSNFIEFEI